MSKAQLQSDSPATDESRGSDSAGHDQTLIRFLERIRKSFSHELRTPLSTIVNYAAVLETNTCADAEEVKDLGRRIRGNAQRVARMVQLLATATALAARPLHASPTDLAALARSVLVDCGGRGEVQVMTDGAPVARIDAEVIGFAVRAYIAVEADAAGGPVHEAELEVHSDASEVVVELRIGNGLPSGAPAPTASMIEVPTYLRHNGGPARQESSMGFNLAQDLVQSHGGDFGVWGRPGAASGLRMRLPAAT